MDEKWCRMLSIVKAYAHRNGYVLAGLFAPRSAVGAHFYYVRPDFADAEPLINAFQTASYAPHWKNYTDVARVRRAFEGCSTPVPPTP